MRAFLAIGLPDAAVRDIRRLQARLPVGRAVPRDNLHLTLAFLDDQPEEALEALDAELQALRAPGFDLRLSGLGGVWWPDAQGAVCRRRSGAGSSGPARTGSFGCPAGRDSAGPDPLSPPM
ncbi:2'-5' RNA ligase family protein [Jhaorihella thermophila]